MGTTAKDITVAATVNADVAVGIPRGDAADNELRDPARCVKPDGTRTYRTAAATQSRRPRTRCSNRAADMAAAKNPWELSLGAGPRTTRLRREPQRRSPQRRVPVPGRRSPQRRSERGVIRRRWVWESAVDSVVIVRGDGVAPLRSHARFDWRAIVAIVGLRDGMARCSTDSGAGWVDRTAHSL